MTSRLICPSRAQFLFFEDEIPGDEISGLKSLFRAGDFNSAEPFVKPRETPECHSRLLGRDSTWHGLQYESLLHTWARPKTNRCNLLWFPTLRGEKKDLMLDHVSTYPDSRVNPRSVRYSEPSEPKPGFMQSGGFPRFYPAHLQALVKWACTG